MRTTLNTMYNNIQGNLNRITTSMTDINERISSGHQMSKLSDNPVNLVSALRFRTTVAELDQFNDNITHGSTVINAAESALTQMKDLALRAKTLSIQAADPALSSDNMSAIAKEINQMFRQAVELGNTQINGQFIFGGQRTTGYTDLEPAPFVIDKGNGHWINGTAKSLGALTSTPLNTTDLAANDLLINGVDVGGVTLNQAATNGLNMQSAFNLSNKIDGTSFSGTTMSAKLTTLTTASAATTAATGDGTISFTLNNVDISVAVTSGDSAAVINAALVSAVNAVTDSTGVTADIGDGTNGAAADTIILENTVTGDNTPIDVSVFANTAPGSSIGLATGPQPADATHNTGQVSYSGDSPFAITTSAADDSILKLVGLDGGGIGNYDEVDDGKLVYGYPLSSGDLKINGIDVPATTSDGNSDIYATASADAKATAINLITSQTGVTADIVAAHVAANGPVNAGTETTRLTGIVTKNAITSTDLAINGTILKNDITTGAITKGLNTGKADHAKTEINNISNTTGVKAKLTTLYAGAAATAPGAQAISFDLNGVPISLLTGGVSAAATAADVVNAINAVSAQTGVEANVGNGSNGGLVNSIVMNNVIRGNENDIDVANLSAGAPAITGLVNITQSVDGTHNTGEISLESDSPFLVSSPSTSPPSDVIITELGLSSADNIGQINYGSTPKYLSSGDLKINGADIFAIPTAVSSKDSTNVLLDAINAKTSSTGVKGTRGADGSLQLTAVDGRNIHIQTSTTGENITKLNGTAGDLDQVYFGALQLKSDRKFILETIDPSINSKEPGLGAIGMAGGSTYTSEPNDIAGDGRIDVFSIHDQTGTVRYTGDRENDLNIKIGKTSTMKIGDNGQTGVADTTIFTTLKDLEDTLKDKNFTSVTGIHNATDTSVLLNSKNTGLEPASQLPSEDLFTDGTFTVNVTDHDFYPATTSPLTINVDTSVDTLDSITKRIDGIPHLSASWNSDGQLEIKSDNPSRYTISLNNDSSNFLNATGVAPEFMQRQGIDQAMNNLDSLMSNLTEQISNFGARANRIDIQTQIYSEMNISTKGNLSEVQDTDMIKAVMELKAKETAYQAALSAASKAMQLSLVDYLR